MNVKSPQREQGASRVAILSALGLVVIIVVAVAMRMSAGGKDRDRISQYIKARGGQVLDAEWDPLGPGWAGDDDNRIYEVRYHDREGNERAVNCKTSMLGGVYFTDDRIVRHGGGPTSKRS